MPAFIFLIFLLRVISVLSDVQCDCNSLTFIKHLLQKEMFEIKLENMRIWSELKKISPGAGLIETDYAKESDIIKREEGLEQKYDPTEKTSETSHHQSETFQTIVQKAFRDEKAERIHFFSHVLSQIDEKTDAITVDLDQTKTEIQTDMNKLKISATDAKSSANECLNTVAALKSDVKDIETSTKGCTDYVSDLKDKFKKHVDDATKRFHYAWKMVGTCRGMKGCETNWKEIWKPHESTFKCFRSFEIKRNWPDASESCKQHNADLVTIESKEENDFIMSNIDFTRDNRMWIGLNDRDNENVWKWQSTNNTLQSGHFSNWNPNEPNDKVGNEDCVEMYENGVWNDLKCNAAIWFVCEKDLEL